jgi:hypothetical protein
MFIKKGKERGTNFLLGSCISVCVCVFTYLLNNIKDLQKISERERERGGKVEIRF